MYPDDSKCYEEATEGEKRVFRFLREAAKPHNDFTCWYQPTIGSSGKEPDFILFGKNFGLLPVGDILHDDSGRKFRRKSQKLFLSRLRD